jgi:hypothetical protein
MTARVQQRLAKAAASFGPEFQHLIEVGDRFVVLAILIQRAGAIVERIHIIGLDRV